MAASRSKSLPKAMEGVVPARNSRRPVEIRPHSTLRSQPGGKGRPSDRLGHSRHGKAGAGSTKLRNCGGNLLPASRPTHSPQCSIRAEEADDADLARALELSMGTLGSYDVSRESEDLARALAESESVASPGNASQLERDQIIFNMYERDGLRIRLAQDKCHRLLRSLGLKAVEAGSVNYSEYNDEMTNQCFYLSLARSYLGPSTLVQSYALAFKRMIEQRVLKQHPEWLEIGQVGECEQAYADFLLNPMRDRSTDFAEFAVVLVDSIAGCAEVFKGVDFDAAVRRDQSKSRKNLLLLWHLPGHYQALVAGDVKGSKPLLTLENVVDAMQHEGIPFVESLG